MASPLAAPAATVPATCHCFRRPPLRIHLSTTRVVAAQLRAVSQAALGLVWLDYRCPHCKQLVPVTVADLLGS